MKKNKNIPLIWLLLTSVFLSLSPGCKKQDDWLAKKSAKANVVPETPKDFQAILDNTAFINTQYISTGLIGADNIVIESNDIATLNESERNQYLWNKTIWAGGISVEWVNYYRVIEMANLVLDGMSKLDKSQPSYNNIIGQAYFHRAMNYFTLAQLFCKTYNAGTAATDLGLPIRLSSEVNNIVQRSKLKELYEQIISDATQAANLLNSTQTYIQRPSSLAAKALLAKIYFVQEDYQNAEKYANEVLQTKSDLIDYNNANLVSPNNAYMFIPNGKNNPEILFYAEGIGYISTLGFLGNVGYVNPDLFQNYSNNDLRKTTFFGQYGTGYNFIASYTGNFNVFFGLATNEVYFMRAECKARRGDYQSGLDDVNHLLAFRYKTGTFVPLTATDADKALRIILSERRKEFANVGNIPWEDLRRLNKDTRFQRTLVRSYNGQIYTLPPNDPRYVLPIPDQEIQLSGLIQNVR